MSYSAHSGYYGSSTQPSSADNNGYNSNRTTNNSMYLHSMNALPNATQQPSYNSSGYEWSSQSPYANNIAAEPSSQAYAPSTDYGYQRSAGYRSKGATVNEPYSQEYYGRSSVRQGQQSAQQQTEGLSNLAYVSGLESANPRSNTSRNTLSHDVVSSQRQNRVRSPIENQSRYSVNPPSTGLTYPMREQASSSSTSSNQLAMDAAAALAGAVGRRNANDAHQPNAAATRKSPGMNNAKSTAASTPRRTASPQTNMAPRSNLLYSTGQQPYQRLQPPPTGSQQRQPPRQRTPSSPYRASNSQNLAQETASTPHSSNFSTAVASNGQTQSSQGEYGTRSSARTIRQTGSIASLVSATHKTESGDYSQHPEVLETAPTFIDPTSIFDPYAQERERRRQAAERAAVEAKRTEEEAKQKAEEEIRAQELREQTENEAAEAAERERARTEAEARKKQNAAKAARNSAGPRSASKAGASSTTQNPQPVGGAQTEEERMAAELKAMMEKMKAFQSKDPSLFKKLWDDMRKPVGSTTAGSVETPSPQPTHQVLPAATSEPQQPSQQVDTTSTERATGRSRSRKTRVGLEGQQLRLNGYPVVIEDNPEGLPDLGRFPAERRIRQSYNKNKSSRGGNEDHEIKDAVSASSPGVPTSRPMSSKTANETPAALSGAFSNSTTKPSEKGIATTKPNTVTIWPLEKRNALTSTALAVLKAIPENANIPLTEWDLYKILESNPSYIDLCQQLESKGLKFHRGHFARELLNSVPDLKGGTPSGHPVPSSGPPKQPVPASTVVSPRQSLHQATHPLPPRQGYQHPHNPPPLQHYPPPPNQCPTPPYGLSAGRYAPPPPTHGYGMLHPPVQSRAAPPSPYTPSTKASFHRPEPVPGSKEAAARKRDFSELIDLTELGDDDNYVVSDKHPRLEGPDSGDEMGADAFKAYQKQKQTMPPQMNYSPPGYLAALNQPMPSNSHFGMLPKQESFAELKGQRHLLAKPLSKDVALKKQYYDPKTVARDILIATGRHPSERPLNVHLAGMLGKYIELDSDVNTLEWDEVDPGGPPLPKVEVVNVPASKPRFKLGDRVHRKSRKPGPVSAIDKTRRPDKEKRINDAMSAPVMQTAPNNPAIDGPVASPLKNQLQKAAFKKPTSKLRHSLLASDAQATPAQFDPTQPPQVQSDRSSSKGPLIAKADMSQEVTPRRKAGRPPGSKNKFPSVAAMKAQAREIKVNIPLRDSTPSTKDKFKCKWKKCSTVLHNLDTLRKHIGRVHRPSASDATNDGYTCWWKKCKFLKQDENTGDWITTKSFDHWEDWLKHIEKEHVTPIAMRWGDGPATTHVDPPTIMEDRKRYLADTAGLETTPFLELTNSQNYPPDTLNLTELDHRSLTTQSMTDKQKSEEAAYIAFMRAHGIHLKKHAESREASKEVLRSLTKRKEMIGPGIDRGGCTLVSEAMRETFEQNPGIRRVVGLND